MIFFGEVENWFVGFGVDCLEVCVVVWLEDVF